MPVRGPDAHGEGVTVGLVGADPFVRKMIDLARQVRSSELRVEPAVYTQETDAAHQAHQIMDRVDVLLFAGPLPYDLAMAAGEMSVPTLYVPTGGPALQTVLARALHEDTFSPARISVDSMTKRDVTDCYAEAGLSATRVRTLPYRETLRPADYLEFHRSLFREGRTSGAVTTIPTVARSLHDDDIPSLMMTPSTQTLRESLRAAILTGSGARLAESRIAIVIVQVPEGALPSRGSPAQYWFQELRLALHRELLHDARRMDAIVLPHDQSSFLVVTTLGALQGATDGLESAPFLARAREALNLDLNVGIGLGRSTLEAQNNAYRAVGMATGDGDVAYLVGSRELVLKLPATGTAQRGRTTPPRDPKLLATSRTLVDALDETRVVDAERAAAILGVTLRTARRTLRVLVDAGLAWPLPPPRSKKVGRPPMLYQLLDERLDDNRR